MAGAKTEIISALDIGTTKVCALIAELGENGRIEIKGIGVSESLGVKGGVVVNIDQTVKTIETAFSEAELMAGKEIQSVYVSLSGRHIRSENSKGMITISKAKEIMEQDIERVINSAKLVSLPPNRTILHILPKQFIIDGQEGIKDPIGMKGSRLEVDVHIVTAAETVIENLSKCIIKTNRKIEELVLEGLVSSYAVLTKDEKELGVVLVDIGGDITNICIFLDDALWFTNVLAIGGEIVTKDISIGLRTSIHEGEKLKREYGCCLRQEIPSDDFIQVSSIGRGNRRLPRQALAEIIEPRMEEIFSLIKQEIRNSGYENLTSAGVVLSGGGSMIEGSKELAEKIFDMPVRISSPIHLDGLINTINSPAYGTSVGLLLYAGEQKAKLSKKMSPKGIFRSFKDWFKELWT